MLSTCPSHSTNPACLSGADANFSHLLQIHFSQVDLELHSNYTPGAGESIFDRDVHVAARTQVMQEKGSQGGGDGEGGGQEPVACFLPDAIIISQHLCVLKCSQSMLV
jgi:hypothetical protein